MFLSSGGIPWRLADGGVTSVMARLLRGSPSVVGMSAMVSAQTVIVRSGCCGGFVVVVSRAKSILELWQTKSGSYDSDLR